MRIALIADSHLSARAPECVANWHAARRAVERSATELTIHLGDITLDGQTHGEELAFASRLIQQWPTETRCVPGNHDVGNGSGEEPLDVLPMSDYRTVFGPSHWVHPAGGWMLMGIDAQVLGSGSEDERALWQWIEDQARLPGTHSQTALFLHRPLLRPNAREATRKGRYVAADAAHRLLTGPLQATLRLVVSGHTHQFLDRVVGGVRHVWMPSTAFVIPDDLQNRLGEKVLGIGVLDLDDGAAARFDLWCPDGMTRHEVDKLGFFRAASGMADAKPASGTT